MKREIMDFWTGLQIYILIALALAGTSYWNLYRPTIDLLEEILGERPPIYGGWFGAIMWMIISFVLAPVTAFLLLSNNNNLFIKKLAISLYNNIVEDSEE